ncbi:MAG: hypothetical protein GY917_19455, partial [Planctomycetaceae bacterium]|nr:hypothetical protein [Planctomycetaceae bacterium]
MFGTFSRVKLALSLLLILLLAASANPVTAQPISPAPTTAQPAPLNPALAQPTDQQPADDTQASTTDEPAPAESKKSADETNKTAQEKINSVLETIVGFMGGILFYEVPLLIGDHTAALVLLVLIFGGIFFTFRFGFINVRLFTH